MRMKEQLCHYIIILFYEVPVQKLQLEDRIKKNGGLVLYYHSLKSCELSDKCFVLFIIPPIG